MRAYIYTSVAPLLAGGQPDLGVAPVRPELGGAGPEHVLVVRGGDGRADQRAHPEDPLHRNNTRRHGWTVSGFSFKQKLRL